MFDYAALHAINYDSIQLNRNLLEQNRPRETTPRSLMLQCCSIICQQGGESAKEAVTSIPSHLATTLLREAILSLHTSAMASIIANWPLHTLCFRDVLADSVRTDIFDEDMGLNVMLFKGITGRTRKCRIRLLDIRGFPLNWNFTKLIVQMWPVLSLKKTQRNVKKLTSLILKTAGLKTENRLAREMIPKLLDDLLSHDMAKHPAFNITLPKGEKMMVKIDQLEFSTQNTFFMEYLLTNCLRSVTPVVIEPSNIVIKSELNVGDEILDSLAPFIVFRGQDPTLLDGVWVENLEDNVFFITCHDLQVFTNMSALAVPNCNIMLQEGRTRRRTSTRYQFTNMLSQFTQLTRLDLAQNSFTGCFKEVLEALRCPLEYLSLRECDLNDQDLIDLSESKHSTSLRQLNLSRICGLFQEDSFAVATSTLFRCLPCFTNVTVIHLQQNQIMDSKVDQLCTIISEKWKRLKSINITENVLTEASVIKIVRECALTEVHHMRIPYAHNFMENIHIFDYARSQFAQRVTDVLKTCGRTDIEVEVSGLAYAVFGQM